MKAITGHGDSSPCHRDDVFDLGTRFVVLALQDHALVGSIAVSPLYDHVDVNTSFVLKRARDMQLSGPFAVALINDSIALHVTIILAHAI
jgi:hypothetical protein